ncbi:hypothetical protein ACLMJK_001292 [Lecanora helva]
MAAISTLTVPIANLHPGLDAVSTSVKGVVTLVWPYASSTQSSSLLLVEPDFRLRKHRGQVRLHFHGSSARAVARAGISAGDSLLLSLQGSNWVQDVTAAATPGKCIEWALEYGERVLLELWREGQEATLLDVDHLAPPQTLSSPPSTPRSSPAYIIPLVTSHRKAAPHISFWQSPAFLKRDHFVASNHDSFVEEDDDFPDSNRQKRLKFGRGSGQWRFADRTPSPEKEITSDAIDNQSPSKTSPTPAAKSHNESSLHTSDKVGAGELIENKHSHSGDLAPEADISPPTPPSTTVDFLPNEETDQLGERRQSGARSPQSASSIATSVNLIRGPSPNLESHFELGIDGNATFGDPTPDFGLDGSVFSRFQKTHGGSPVVDDIEQVPEHREGSIEHRDSPSSLITATPEALVDEEDENVLAESMLIKESAHEFQFLADSSFNVPQSPDDKQRSAQQIQASQQNLGDQAERQDSEPEIFQEALQELGDAESSVDDKGYTSSGEIKLKSQSLDEVVTESAESSPIAGSQTFVSNQAVVEERAELTPLNLAPINEQSMSQGESEAVGSKIDEANRPEERKSAKIEIIDLESEDEGPDILEQSPSYTPGKTSSESPDYNITQTATEMPMNSPRSTTAMEDAPPDFIYIRAAGDIIEGRSFTLQPNSPEHYSEEEHVSFIEPRLLLPSDMEEDVDTRTQIVEPMLKTLPIQSIRSPTHSPQQYSSASPTSEMGLSRLDSPAAEITAELQPQAEAEQNSRNLSMELPSTIPETIQQPPNKSQLLTPDVTQRTSFVSQASSVSVHTAPDDETLPTPQLTQGRSDIGGLPTTPTIHEMPSPVQAFRGAEVEGSKADEKGPNEDLPMTKRVPTLIEKLKAMRRLSSQTSQKIGDASAVSPWFTPKRSSQVVLDSEVESEIESLSESDRKSSKVRTDTKIETPEKQKLLAESFIRSSPQRMDIDSLASSPAYLPPSQDLPPGFRTTLSYFVSLTTLQSHFSLSVDILAIALNASHVTRATSGPRDYHQNIYLTDPSSSTSKKPITTVQIFRSYNKCFPVIEKGDAVLLRDFKVQSFQRQLALLSTQSSAWAVFRKQAEVQIRGPPVELGAEERGFARGLWRWWDGLGQAMRERLDKALPKEIQKHSGPERKSSPKQMEEKRQSEGSTKKKSIEGLGVDLPGSQNRLRRAPPKERSPEPDGVIESVEPSKRVLRPRGARGMPEKSESPTKAINRRSGTVFTGGLGEPESE